MASKSAETPPPNVSIVSCNCQMFKNHEKSLPTMEDLGNHVTEFLLRTKGRKKMSKKMDKLTEAVKKDLSKPVIVDYLTESWVEYESREDHIRKICPLHHASQGIPPTSLVSEVPLVAVNVTVPETSSTFCDTGVIPRVGTEIVGPDLSESDESEKEAEDDKGGTNEKMVDNPQKSPITTTLSVPVEVEEQFNDAATNGVNDKEVSTLSSEVDDAITLTEESVPTVSEEDNRDTEETITLHIISEEGVEEDGREGGVPTPAETVVLTNDNEDNTDKENVEMELTEDASNNQSSEELQQQDDNQNENLNIIRGCGLDLSDEDDVLQLDYGYDENDDLMIY